METSLVVYERLCDSVEQIRKNKNLFSKSTNNVNKLEPSDILIGTIFLLNALVYIAWKVPNWRRIMNKYFTINARQFSKASLLLSAFSHKSLPHLCIDMLVLYVSGRGVMQPYGEMGLVEFTAMYLIGCVVSSLTSIDFGRRLRLRRDVIGASGAILSVVGYFSLANAAKKSPMIFLLNIQFDTILGLFGIILLNMKRLSMRGRNVSHAAHLGGILFGMLWYVSTYVWRNSINIL